MTVYAVILAAGQASRMGRAKQLLEVEGIPLVLRAITQAQAANLCPVVVLGAHREVVASVLPAEVSRVFCAQWAQGMGRSLAAGVDWAQRAGATQIVVMLCDQPLVDAGDLERLVAACAPEDVEVAAAVFGEGVVGTPACFKKVCWASLLALSPGQGARRLLRSGKWRVAHVQMEAAAIDVDTPEEFTNFLATQRPSAARKG